MPDNLRANKAVVAAKAAKAVKAAKAADATNDIKAVSAAIAAKKARDEQDAIATAKAAAAAASAAIKANTDRDLAIKRAEAANDNLNQKNIIAAVAQQKALDDKSAQALANADAAKVAAEVAAANKKAADAIASAKAKVAVVKTSHAKKANIAHRKTRAKCKGTPWHKLIPYQGLGELEGLTLPPKKYLIMGGAALVGVGVLWFLLRK